MIRIYESLDSDLEEQVSSEFGRVVYDQYVNASNHIKARPEIVDLIKIILDKTDSGEEYEDRLKTLSRCNLKCNKGSGVIHRVLEERGISHTIIFTGANKLFYHSWIVRKDNGDIYQTNYDGRTPLEDYLEFTVVEKEYNY